MRHRGLKSSGPDLVTDGNGRVVMEQLGHSTITLTMNVYSHVIPALQRDAADRMDTLLGMDAG